MPRDPLDRFKKGSIIVHILYHASKKRFYGSWLKSELERHGYEISFGTLYPWLNTLEKRGFLKVNEETGSDGKNRKFYSITQKGKDQLEQIKQIIKELYDEVIGEY